MKRKFPCFTQCEHHKLLYLVEINPNTIESVLIKLQFEIQNQKEATHNTKHIQIVHIFGRLDGF